ncbi:MAG: thioesterase family protein [Treponema sp.]|jgi:predicted thioesterase|nr:thioesterase family protein [Treponema sp.]
MDGNDFLKPGMSGEKKTSVTEPLSARAWGSGGLPVYATPAMVALMEGACVNAVDSALPAGFSTVGTELAITHSAATPLGMQVRATGVLLEIQGRKLRFQVEAFDQSGKIGEGTHSRFIIENERFLKKAQEKQGGSGSPE